MGRSPKRGPGRQPRAGSGAAAPERKMHFFAWKTRIFNNISSYLDLIYSSPKTLFTMIIELSMHMLCKCMSTLKAFLPGTSGWRYPWPRMLTAYSYANHQPHVLSGSHSQPQPHVLFSSQPKGYTARMRVPNRPGHARTPQSCCAHPRPKSKGRGRGEARRGWSSQT